MFSPPRSSAGSGRRLLATATVRGRGQLPVRRRRATRSRRRPTTTCHADPVSGRRQLIGSRCIARLHQSEHANACVPRPTRRRPRTRRSGPSALACRTSSTAFPASSGRHGVNPTPRSSASTTSALRREMSATRPRNGRRTPNFWLQAGAPGGSRAGRARRGRNVAAGEPGENEFRWVDQGRPHHLGAGAFPVIKDETGKPVGMRGVTFDITDRKETERRLALLAEISTTGLITRPSQELARDIARRTAHSRRRLLHHPHAARGTARGHRVCARSPRGGADGPARSRSIDVALEQRALRRDHAPSADRSSTTTFRDRVRIHLRSKRPRGRCSNGTGRGAACICPLLSHGSCSARSRSGAPAAAPFSSADVRLVEAIASRATLCARQRARCSRPRNARPKKPACARAEAEEAGRVKDEFLATLSHELRTPLNAILGWAHMLRDPALPADRRQAAIETIVRNAQSQEQLISDILDVQRIMAGKIRLNLRTVDLGDDHPLRRRDRPAVGDARRASACNCSSISTCRRCGAIPIGSSRSCGTC